jgi:uncharacterized protein YybS (DUF2232 family)
MKPETRVSPRFDALGLAEGSLLADVGIVLDLATIYLPLIGTVLAPTVPTPFAVLMLRRGSKVTLLAAAVASFLVGVLSGPHFGWRMGLEALIGMLMGYAMRNRWRWPLVLAAGTIIVATVTFAAAIGVIFVTGLPVHDIVQELRNGLAAAAWAVATGASLIGGEAQWLALRPLLVSIGLVALRLWPLLLYAYVAAAALPTVAVYYAIANSTARILGEDTLAFPPRWVMRLVRLAIVIALAPVAAWRRLMRRVRGGKSAPVSASALAPEGERDREEVEV